MSQFDVINRNIKHQGQVSNNEYLILLNIDNLQQKQGKDWYEAIDGMSMDSFLVALSDFVHYSKFKAKGVEKLLKRLQERGFLNVEHLKVQVTEKWRDLVEEWGGYYQNKISDEAQMKKVDDLFADIMTPKTLSVKEYKDTVRQFNYEAKKALKRNLLGPEWKERLEKFDKMIESPFVLKQFFEARLRANGEADNPPNVPPKSKNTEGGAFSKAETQKNIDERLNWRISLDMTEVMFFQELKDTKFWIELKSKRKMALSAAEQARLTWVLEALEDVEGSKALYSKRIEKLKAEQAQHQGPVSPEVVAEMAKARVTTVKEA